MIGTTWNEIVESDAARDFEKRHAVVLTDLEEREEGRREGERGKNGADRRCG